MFLLVLFNLQCHTAKKEDSSPQDPSHPSNPIPKKDWTTTLTVEGKTYATGETVHIYKSSSKMLTFSINEEITALKAYKKEGEGEFTKIHEAPGSSSLNYFTHIIDTEEESTFVFKVVSEFHSIQKEHLFTVILVKGKRRIQSIADIEDVSVFYNGNLQNGRELLFNQYWVKLDFTFDDVPEKYIEYKEIGEPTYKKEIVHGTQSGFFLPAVSIVSKKKIFHVIAVSGSKKIQKRNEFEITLDPPVVFVDPSIVKEKDFFTCGSKSEPCPTNIGLLLGGKGSDSYRCTTFHYKNGIFGTNWHCLPASIQNKKDASCSGLITSYFLTSTGRKEFECDRIIVQKQRFADYDHDYAFYTVKEPVSLPPIEWENPSVLPDQVEAWSVYANNGDEKNLVLKKSVCEVLWDAYPLYAVKNKAHVYPLISYGGDKNSCLLVPGTSGSALLSSSQKLLGIHHTGYKPNTLPFFTKNVLKEGTNAACIENVNSGLNKKSCEEHGFKRSEYTRMSTLLSNLMPPELKTEFDAALGVYMSNRQPGFSPDEKYDRFLFMGASEPQGQFGAAYMVPVPTCDIWKTKTYTDLPGCAVKISYNEKMKPEKIESAKNVCEMITIRIKLEKEGLYSTYSLIDGKTYFDSGPILLPACTP